MRKQNYWLLKSEPETWSFEEQMAVGIEPWNGVRNYQARNNLRAMEIGDLAFFYHSNKGKAVVGIVQIVSDHYPDIDSNFSCVDVKFYQKLNKPVTLAAIKGNSRLQNMGLVKQSRLSVMAVSYDDFKEILKMSETELKNTL